MELSAERVPAVGEGRTVPTPDSISRDYLLLALRMGRLVPGLTDWYYGPAELRDLVDSERPPEAAALRHDASTLLARLPEEASEPERRRWLQAQVVSLEAQAMSLAGDPLPYADFVACSFDIYPERVPESVFANAAEDLGRLLPPDPGGQATVAERLAAWDRRFHVGHDRLRDVGAWLLNYLREKTEQVLGLPPAERVLLDFVEARTWRTSGGYYGDGTSRVQINSDLPLTVLELIECLTHEAYPGHHTLNSWMEHLTVEEMGRVEASLSLVNAPARLVNEGLAVMAERTAAPDHELADMLIELYSRAGLQIASDPVAARDAADRQVRIRRALYAVRAVAGNAAYLLHVEGAPRDEVLAYLQRYLITSKERASRRLEFIEKPLTRAYPFASYEGERLVRRWFDLAPLAQMQARYQRLVLEQLTPGQLDAELTAAGFGPGSR